MYYRAKHTTHIVKVTESYIVKVYKDSVFIQKYPSSAYIGDRYEIENEGTPITQEIYELEFNKTIENIKNH
jgi:hypothetical protein